MKATVEVNISQKAGKLNPHIYGQYFEHLEDCIYPAVHDPSISSTDQGLRKDVIDAAKELDVPIIRWPGGCFADLYHWEDGVGPKEQRPVRRNWHWQEMESNQFGTDEFLEWCEQVGAEPYINFNLGTGTLDEALRWMDYCNGRNDTDDVLQRKKNGRNEPYNVKYWGIGNETWGSWEAGQMDARTYGQTLRNWAEFIKRNDPQAQLLGVGSSGGNDPDWDREVLKRAGSHIDYLTFHEYAYSLDRKSGSEYYSVVFTPHYMKLGMEQMVRAIDEMQAESHFNQDIYISVDEWNIRHYIQSGEQDYKLNRQSPRNLQDAIFGAGFLNAMIQLHPKVGMGNYVFLVNGNGVINVNEKQLVKTPLYYVFQQYMEWMQGEVLSVNLQTPTITAPLPQLRGPNHDVPERNRETVGYIDTVAVQHPDESVVVSIINRHQSVPIDVDLYLPEGYDPETAWTLVHDDIYAVNDFGQSDQVKPVVEEVNRGTKEWCCPAHSVVLLKCKQHRS